MIEYEQAGQSAQEILEELECGIRVTEMNAPYYMAAVEMVALHYGDARLVKRVGKDMLWVMPNGNLVVSDVSAKVVEWRAQ